MARDTRTTRTPVQKRGIKTREKIIDAAMRVFSKKGFHAANTKDIAREAGIAIGSFYAYFKDKKSVFLEIYRGVSHGPLNDIGYAPTDSCGQQTGVERVTALLRGLFSEHSFSPDFQREVSYMRFKDPEVEALHNTIHENLRKQIVAALEPQKENLRVADLDAAVFVVLCACEEVIRNSRLKGHGMDPDRLLKTLADMVACFLYKHS